MPAQRTYSKKLGQRHARPAQNARSSKRNANTDRQRGEPASLVNADRRTPSPVTNKMGLDWDWVETLDQDPRGKTYFPARFAPPNQTSFLGDDEDQPDITNVTDLTNYTAWVLSRVKKMLASKIVVSMIEDPNLEVKWTLSLNSQVHNRISRYREIKLVRFQSPATNFEAAYAAMVGIILPPEHACNSCKANQGPFKNCIVVPKYLNGACAGCHYNSSGSRCSHRSDSSKRIRIAGVSRTIPALPHSLANAVKPRLIPSDDIESIRQQQRVIGISIKSIADFKSQLHRMIDIVAELEHQGLVAPA
ncbi:hypothetical protein F4805DRAFT_463877 [Annulohypoxylon moriforme]|nr:hypothetical protein F4805DRAFT_463877 [Annulohypoxylon moriforme]